MSFPLLRPIVIYCSFTNPRNIYYIPFICLVLFQVLEIKNNNNGGILDLKELTVSAKMLYRAIDHRSLHSSISTSNY